MTEIGREKYARYIQSSRWQARRLKLMKKRGRRCQACGSEEDLHVHHATYERFGNERDDDLVVLCETHHDLVHRFHKLSGLSLYEATQRFLSQYQLKKVSPKRRRELLETPHTPDGWRPANVRDLQPGEKTVDWRVERRTLAGITRRKAP